jgi:transposase InsO family protein
MPWQESSIMSLRQEFCALARQEGANVSALCRRYGISRKTGYKWLGRAADADPGALADRSRRPHTAPSQTPEAVAARVLAVRDAHPTWGGRKIARRLADLGEPHPAPSTITAILARTARLDPARVGQPRDWQRFERDAPNALWQLDFKGHVPMVAGRCHPLVVLDDHSRFVLGLRACADEGTAIVQTELTTLFQRFGLPWQLLCDHGPPWGTTQAESGLTALGAWLIRLGIEVLHGRPYHPQTQGKLERVNRTLAEDVLAAMPRVTDVLGLPRLPDLPSYQRAFDRWRTNYNHERPHQAIDLATPGSRYRASPRTFPDLLPEIVYEAGDQVRKVQGDGTISFKNRPLKISKALAGQPVGVRPTTTDGVWEVRYCHVVVRTLDLRAYAVR